jgi:hypothetical protein
MAKTCLFDCCVNAEVSLRGWILFPGKEKKTCMNDILKRDVSIKLHGFIHCRSQYRKNLKSPVRSRFEIKK